MKKNQTLYWILTSLIVLLDGVMPALTFNTDLAKQGISHLGYPDYFRLLITFFKVTGATVLILPFFKGRIKEWAYAGFTFNFFSAFISHTVVDGMGMQSVFPLFALLLLGGSYYYYNKIRETSFTVKKNKSSYPQLSHA